MITGPLKMSFSFIFPAIFIVTTCDASVLDTTVAQRTIEIVDSINTAWKIVQSTVLSFGDKKKILYTKIDNINMGLEEMSWELNGFDQTIDMMNQMRPNKELRQLLLLNGFLAQTYGTMERYVRDFEDNEQNLRRLSNEANAQNFVSVRSLSNMTYNFLVENDFLHLISNFTPELDRDKFCKGLTPSQQMFHNFLEEIVLMRSKAYLMMQLAHMIKTMYGQDETEAAKQTTQQFKLQTNKIFKIIQSRMIEVPRGLWKCEPARHIQGETYVKLTNLLNGYILNKVNLNPKGECRDSCEAFTFTKKQKCGENKWCHKQTYCPKIVNCQLVDSDMTVCEAKSRKERRYDYVEFSNGRTFGRKHSCRKDNLSLLSGYRSWIFWECSYCFCLCDEGDKYYSDRYINLRAAIANIDNNRVVTGLRFVKNNRIIHLQIQEGTLLPQGRIDLATIQWVPVENYSILDNNILEGQDYHKLSWENRALDLTSVILDKTTAVTGVRFRRVGTRLDFEVLGTPFNFSTGQLIKPSTHSLYYDPTDMEFRHKFPNELKLIRPDIPTRAAPPLKADHSTNKFVRFVNSDYEKDAAQTTVPYFDAQPVRSTTPLSGIGIFHKGKKGSGGFVAPKIYTYDYSEHFGPPFPNNDEQKRK